MARNEAFFREVNERIKEVAEELDRGAAYEFLCECADPTCTQRVELSLSEYDRIRAEPTRFVLAPDHDVQEIEQVVEREPDHLVVEKVGTAGDTASSLDPRDS
jgi:hypothetical protein